MVRASECNLQVRHVAISFSCDDCSPVVNTCATKTKHYNYFGIGQTVIMQCGLAGKVMIDSMGVDTWVDD